MGLFKKLFGGGEKKPSEYVDTRGIYFYVRCNNCDTIVKVRADKEYDLSRDGDGYIWHKTIVDSRCFRSIPTVVVLDRNFEIVDAEISGGEYVTEADFLAFGQTQVRTVTEDASEEE